jgi:predicted MPP superfamily phosphohydrolase
MNLKIVVISDLHCHQVAKYPEELAKHGFEKKQESYILTDNQLPISQDPFLSFKELVRKLKDRGETLDSDILVNLGDFGNKSCPEGIKKGWEVTNEIAKLTNVKTVVSTVGNHDVDSRNIFDSDSFKFIKKLDINIFPTNDKIQNELYWQNGFVITEYDKYRLLIINTVHNHINKTEAEHGLISNESLNLLEEELEKINDSKLGIAICHHSPMGHTRIGSNNTDLMFNGDQLIPLLDKYNFELIMHGHKHDPMIRYGGGSGDSSLVFSAGSFSAIKDILLPMGVNTFHIINLEIKGNARSTGIIDTWFFIPTQGWKKNVPNPYFKNRVGFGNSIDIKRKSQEILDWFINTANKKQLNYINEFIPQFKEIEFLIPIDIERLHSELRRKRIIVSKGEITEETKIEFKG